MFVTDPVKVVADPQGNWSIPTPPGAQDKGTVRATATDPAGNVSPEGTKVIDTTAPEAPRVDVANATEVAGGPGSAEPGSTVTVVFPDGSKGSTTAAPDGSYSVPTPPGMPDGGEVSVTATDEANFGGPGVN